MIPTAKLKVFISHSFINKNLTDEFFEKFGTHHSDCEILYDMTAYAGNFNERLLQGYASKCDIAILLINSKFMASDYCNNKELPILQEREKKGEVVIIPVLFQPCDFRKWNTDKGGDLTFFQIKKGDLRSSRLSGSNSEKNNRTDLTYDDIDEKDTEGYHYLLYQWIKKIRESQMS